MRIATLLMLAAIASPVSAQQQTEEVEVISIDDVNAQVVVRRSLQIPDEIAFAVTPYGMCLDTKNQAAQENGISIFDAPQQVPLIIEECRSERDEAIFMASTALERGTAMEIDARREMIFSTLEGIEGLILNTALPKPELMGSGND